MRVKKVTLDVHFELILSHCRFSPNPSGFGWFGTKEDRFFLPIFKISIFLSNFFDLNNNYVTPELDIRFVFCKGNLKEKWSKIHALTTQKYLLKIKKCHRKIKILKISKKNQSSFVPNHPNPEGFGLKRQCERVIPKSTSSVTFFTLIPSGKLTPAPNGFSHVVLALCPVVTLPDCNTEPPGKSLRLRPPYDVVTAAGSPLTLDS